ncbi:MAG: PIG-L deacetylase family protein [Patescibacteria group bacterium]
MNNQLQQNALPTNKTILSFFAHPDDEAFGPAGTMAQLAQQNKVHLLMATRGDKGQNVTQDRKLISIRKNETQKSAQLLGLSSVKFLHFTDGRLCNVTYQKLAKQVEAILEQLKPEIIITFEPRGLSGHLDHVAVSSVAAYWYHRKPYIQQLWYFGLTREMRGQDHTYFVHKPPGYERDEFDLIVPIEEQWELKKQAIQAHASQQKDTSWMLNRMEQFPKEEHFLIERK